MSLWHPDCKLLAWDVLSVASCVSPFSVDFVGTIAARCATPTSLQQIYTPEVFGAQLLKMQSGEELQARTVVAMWHRLHHCADQMPVWCWQMPPEIAALTSCGKWTSLVRPAQRDRSERALCPLFVDAPQHETIAIQSPDGSAASQPLSARTLHGVLDSLSSINRDLMELSHSGACSSPDARVSMSRAQMQLSHVAQWAESLRRESHADFAGSVEDRIRERYGSKMVDLLQHLLIVTHLKAGSSLRDVLMLSLKAILPANIAEEYLRQLADAKLPDKSKISRSCLMLDVGYMLWSRHHGSVQKVQGVNGLVPNGYSSCVDVRETLPGNAKREGDIVFCRLPKPVPPESLCACSDAEPHLCSGPNC